MFLLLQQTTIIQYLFIHLILSDDTIWLTASHFSYYEHKKSIELNDNAMDTGFGSK